MPRKLLGCLYPDATVCRGNLKGDGFTPFRLNCLQARGAADLRWTFGASRGWMDQNSVPFLNLPKLNRIVFLDTFTYWGLLGSDP